MIWVGIGFLLIGVQALIIAVFYGGREAERAEQPARRPAGPDLSTTVAARIAEADRIAAALAGDLDAVDRHFATAAAILQPDRDPIQNHIDAEAHRLLAALDVPVIPGTDLRTTGDQS